jgi:hypothetical protein
MGVADKLRRRGQRLADTTKPLLTRLRPLWREPWTPLALLALLQWVCLAALAASVERNGWLFYQGGDETHFYTTAWAFGRGHLPYAGIGYAWSLVISPISWFAGASVLDALPAIVLLQVVVLLPLALGCMYGIGARIGGRAIGYLAATLWVLTPYLAIPLFVARYHDRYVGQFLPQALGLTAMGDFPAMVALIVAAFFVVRAMDEGRLTDAVLAALATGFAIGIKPSIGLFAVAAGAGLLLARRFRAIAVFGLALVPALLTLAVWKYRGLGYLPAFQSNETSYAGSLPLAAFGLSPALALIAFERYSHLFDWNQLQANIAVIKEVFWSWRILEYLPFAGLIAVARRSFSKAVFVGIWFASFFLVKGSTYVASVESGSFWRLLMPAWPALILLIAAIPVLVPIYGQKLAERLPHAPSRVALRSPLVLAPAALLVALPLLAVATLPKLAEPKAVHDSDNGLFLPVSSELRLSAERQGKRVLLSWKQAGDSSTRVFYRILRARPNTPWTDSTHHPARNGISCRRPNGGAANCFLEMEVIGGTRSLRFVDSPPPGPWSYRIGEAANSWDDLSKGDVLVLSEAVDVSG